MSNLDPKKLYQEYLESVFLMQLATSANEQPWLCNVWYVKDSDDNFYWTSRKTRRHSQEIAQNPKIACTFHQNFVEGLGQKGQAVIIAGHASLVVTNKIADIYDLYEQRYPKLPTMQDKQSFVDQTGDHFFYQVTPDEIIWWDEVNFPEDSRQVVK